ncbi:Hypothetical protein R9X50_00109100 [Acrodontium crateriforme]|uniref:Non-hemolytic phospholipase C n=1 Tax=Acrodontium crateriforme TaxID=150365 RepID=A0AAQ3R5I0_9PEZI|nr:Hypothetical protein R9X50_00109100 [Acrodontium crateriforme]
MVFSKPSLTWATVFVAAASAGSLNDIKHVVLFMQENRAFDHYYGSMAGVRGFADPNVQINPDNTTVFHQLDPNSNVTYLTPWYWNYLGGDYYESTQCTTVGDNSYDVMQTSLNGGLNNKWPSSSAFTLAYYKRRDIPTHWSIADGWTIADMYQESVLAATDPNRVHWMSGTVNQAGSPSNPDGKGSIIIDNNATPGCDTEPNINCYPFTWKTVPEYWQEAGVKWQLYQDADNFEDNMLAYFQQYQDASKNKSNPLTKYGNSYIGLDKFYSDAMNGTLPEISIIIGPAELAEHPPYIPKDGGWLQKQVVDAVTKGKSAKNTALLISYDEGGGYADHVVPFTAPKGTKGEWIEDPYNKYGEVPIGPGFRIPFTVISPWTRGGNVFTEHADHTSQILFVEKWLAAKGYKNIQSKEVNPWRREHMSDLVNMFDFDHPDYSVPNVVDQAAPLRDTSQPDPEDGLLGALYGNYIGTTKCQSDYKNHYPPVPYGEDNVNQDMSKIPEQGFKAVRGTLTEGRYLTFEHSGYALTNNGHGHLTASKATAKHEQISQRWILHQQGLGDSNVFIIQSAKDKTYLKINMQLTKNIKDATQFTIKSLGTPKGYTIQAANGQGLTTTSWGGIEQYQGFSPAGLSVFSVTYQQ